MKIRQPYSYQEPNAEVIVTLCDSLRNHIHSKTVSHLGQHWLFSTHQVEHNQCPLLCPSSIPSQACIALHRKNRYQISITLVIAKALLIIIHTCPSKSVLSLSFLVLSCIQNKQTSSFPETSDGKAHWSRSCTSLQQTSCDVISLISNVMCNTS